MAIRSVINRRTRRISNRNLISSRKKKKRFTIKKIKTIQRQARTKTIQRRAITKLGKITSKISAKVSPKRKTIRKEPGKVSVRKAPGKVSVRKAPGKVSVRKEPSKVSVRKEPGKVSVRKDLLGFKSSSNVIELQLKKVSPKIRKQKMSSFKKEVQSDGQRKVIINPRTGKPFATVEAVEKQKGFKRITQRIDTKISKTRSKIVREKDQTKNILRRAKLTGLSIIRTAPATVVGLASLVKLPFQIAKAISTKEGRRGLNTAIKQLPSDVKRDLKNFGKVAKQNPEIAVGNIVSNVGGVLTTTKVLSKAGRVTSKISTKVSPKFVGTAKKGQILKVPIKVNGKKQIVDLQVAGKIGGPTLPKEKLAKQVALAGKKTPAATSTQADRLVNVIRTQKTVRKPIPNEAKFTKKTKLLLNKFDKGNINKKELIELNDRIVKIEKEKGLLERSFFADPKGRLRPSRFGKQSEASFIDYLAGDVTFKNSKPQVLLFGDVKIQKLPKNLKDVGKKLKQNKPLTKFESDRLLKFQLKQSGKFKPIGFLSGESEITLAPGEIIKRVKKAGVTIVNGKRVPITQVKIGKTTKRTRDLLSKADKGKLEGKELIELKSRLKKETGFTPKLSSDKTGIKRARVPKPSIKPSRPSTSTKKPSSPSTSTKKPSSPSTSTKKPSSPSTSPISRVITTSTSPISRVSKTSTSPISRVSKPSTSPKKPSKPSTSPKKPIIPKRARRPIRPKPPIRIKLKKNEITKKRKKKKGRAYNVYARPLKKRKNQKKPKLVKVNKVPLKKTRSEDYRNYLIDTSLSRTGKIKPTNLKPRKGKLKVPLGYAKRTKNKFRTYRIVKGKRIKLPKGKVIEKRGRLLDTIQERKQINLARRIKQITPKKKKISKTKKPKKMSNSLRLQRLKNLEKARKIRMQNIKRNKR